MSGKRRDRKGALEPSREVSLLHLRVGWWSLLAFLSLGIALEGMHGFKVGFYLDVANETRRHMWTLGHAHGTLLSVLSLVFAASTRAMTSWNDASRELASRCLLGALTMLPLGFLLGGAFTHGGDPGLGILLVPPGALLLFTAVLITARATLQPPPGPGTRGGKSAPMRTTAP
jgi:hypothetical protein